MYFDFCTVKICRVAGVKKSMHYTIRTSKFELNGKQTVEKVKHQLVLMATNGSAVKEIEKDEPMAHFENRFMAEIIYAVGLLFPK